MATTVYRIGPIGNYQMKGVKVTALANARQAVKVGSYVHFAVPGNTNDTQAVKAEPNINSAGAASNGSVAITNADSGADTADILCIVSE